MNISYNWLKQYITITETPQELAEILTDLGLEIGGIEKKESIKGGLEGLVIGEVTACAQHPNADKLSCTKVNIGNDTVLDVVCGAPNVAAGQKVVVATVGTVMYSGDDSFKIKKSKLRGEPSEGMICAEDEIGLGKSHDGILVLPEDAKVGTLAKDYFEIDVDYVLEVDITPNRADALSHFGVARDLAAYYNYKGINSQVVLPEIEAIEKTANLPFELNVEDTEACSRYAGVTIKGVTVADSPDWLKKRLESIGVGSINNIVDVTNFVLHELGQPLHAFDYAVSGEKIEVKSSLNNVKFTTLDGIERTINQNELMICNANEPMCIAGVFGGEKSGVSETTTDIFLESAYFNPVSVRKTSKKHALKTDASYRFERGIDPHITITALQRAIALIIEVAGGEVASDIQDLVLNDHPNFEVDFNINRCNNLIGSDISEEVILKILASLDIEVLANNNGKLKLSVPPYRVDVQRECDVIEEVLRIYGFNNVAIPTALKSSLIINNGIPQEKVVKVVSNLLSANGFDEILNNSLTSKKYYQDLEHTLEENHIELQNPLSKDLDILRRSMLFGGLESIARNQNMKNSDLKFFELGKTYSKTSGDDYHEEKHLSLFLTGDDNSLHWATKSQPVNYFTLKGYVDLIFGKLGIAKLKAKALQNEFLVEGIALYFKKTKIAEFGKVKKSVAKLAGVKQTVYFADINWDEVLKLVQFVKTKFTPLAKFHPVKRDLSLMLNENVKYADLERIANESERKILKSVELFDVYEGDKLPDGKKSYALSFILQSDEATLNDKQIDKVMDKLQAAFKEKLQAELR